MAEVIYSNVARVRTNLHDLAIDFGLMTPTDAADPTKAEAVSKVTVILPLTQVRAITDILVDHLAKYEKDFGPIPGRPDGNEPMRPGATPAVEG